MKSYKYRLYPTPKQATKFNETLVLCQRLYNAALEHRREVYRISQKSTTLYNQILELTHIKQMFPEYSNIYSQVLQNVLMRVDGAFKNFFRRLEINVEKSGFPRFKGRDRYDSFCYTQKGFWIRGNRIELSKIGMVKAKFHRSMQDGCKIQTCTIKREGSEWYVVFVCTTPPIPIQKKVVADAIGIDLGLTDFVVLSNGAKIQNPKYLKQSEEKLKVLGSKYSIGKSKKVKLQLGNLHRKVFNQRHDFQHKLSFALVNGFDLIVYEDLKVREMIDGKDHNLQKHISDASWGSFISMLKYKAEDAGTTLIAVNPKGTTQRCSNCDHIVPKSLYVRLHNCTNCGFTASRDHNAALNIKKLGISLVGLG